MNFSAKQSDLMQLGKYLMLGGTFPYCPLQIKIGNDSEPMLTSYQTTENSSIFRFCRVGKSFFNSIQNEPATVHVNIQKLMRTISGEGADDVIGISLVEDNKLKIECPRTTFYLNTVQTSPGFRDKMTFALKGGIIQMKDRPEIKIRNKISMGLKTFKKMVAYSSAVETELFTFTLTKADGFNVRVGSLEKNAEYANYKPVVTIDQHNSDVNSSVSLGMKELVSTLTSDVVIYLETGMPTVVTESSHHLKFGTMIAPYQRPEEDE